MGNKKPRIARMKNDFIETKTLENIRAHKRHKKLKRRMRIIVAAGMLPVVLAGSTLARNYVKLQDLEEQRVVAQQELESLDLQQKELAYYIGLLEDEEYVAKLARSEYYLTKDNEIVFSFPDDRNPDHLEATDENPDADEEETDEE
ncbi:septum formation initiator family protein [Alkalibacterium sp. m-11]|uniref:Septum formation initiator family protein n=1 Tax=Alkalibacterium indicireducens TaxID=398758 RepID=A0ABP3KF97_9LACT